MKYLFITSSKDRASCTMRDYLLEFEGYYQSTISYLSKYSYKNVKKSIDKKESPAIEYKIFKSNKYTKIDLLDFDSELINLTNLDNLGIDDCFSIFLSRHSSNSKIPTLTSHFTGNFSSNNSLGGNPFELGISYPTFQKEYMKKLFQMKQHIQHYDLTIEATHHGPTASSNPLIFIEIGSSEEEWQNKTTASAVCKCLLKTIIEDDNHHPKKESKIAIGVGGNHYPQKFNELILFSDVAFASIASKYNLKFVDERMLKQMKTRSIEEVTDIYFDEKSLGAEKNHLISISESLDLNPNFI
ncbi:MAG TPA: D-aminoacyl-tRNA deacylase [Candidatus Nitrosocosmicus sp.]|nr:D-aminoacyl-tRNA deacylase [Candidatus Nitrosocosmicus sp.]